MKYYLTLFIILFLASLSVGGSGWNLYSLLEHLTDPTHRSILLEIRLPRALLLIFVGASLALSGALLQTLLQNPLAEPYTLGLSGASSLGATLSIFLKLEPHAVFVPLLASTFCFSATFIILKLQKYLKGAHSLILAGVMISLFCGSIVILLMALLDPFQTQGALFWMMGQVGTSKDLWWPALALIFILTYFVIQNSHRDLDRLLIGQDIAHTLIKKPEFLKRKIIFIATLLCAASVSIAGLIGFVGLLAPHISLYFHKTPLHRNHLRHTCIIGSLLLLSSDVLARLLSSYQELPTGSLIAVLGAPLLIYFLTTRKSYVES